MIRMTGAFFCWGSLVVEMVWLSCRKFVWSQNFNRLASHLPFLKVRKILYTTRFPAADIHDIYYGEKRRLNRNLMGEIATCQYIEKSTSLIFQGFSSTGKTWLGCAYAKEACRHHNRTRYIRLPDLLSEFHEKKLGKGGKEKLLGKYAAYKVLVIDEWLISDLTAEDIDFLFELSELRYDSTSTIFCTLYKQEDWLMRLGGGARAESIIERYSHNVIRIEIGDENMRDIFGSRKTT